MGRTGSKALTKMVIMLQNVHAVIATHAGVIIKHFDGREYLLQRFLAVLLC